MTPFWKEERWGYSIYQNEQNLLLGLDPPIPLIGRLFVSDIVLNIISYPNLNITELKNYICKQIYAS